MQTGAPRILVIGYGNPGRLDDGLGPALADVLERLGLPGVTIESDYQLTVEDAATVADHDVVIFADASADGPEPFAFQCLGGRASCTPWTPCVPTALPERIEAGRMPAPQCRFTSHHLEPGEVLDLARCLFGGQPEGYLLAIRGYDFNEFGEGLSAKAQVNLDRAVEFLATAIRSKQVNSTAAERPCVSVSGLAGESTLTHGEQQCRTASM